MSVNEQEVSFKDLVEACAGANRNDQEDYLVRAIMKFMVERYGGDHKVSPPDANILQRHGLGDLIGNGGADIELLDAIYSALSRSLLDDTDYHPNDLRPKIVEYMRSDLRRRHEIQEEVGV